MFEEIFEWDILLHHSASIDSRRENFGTQYVLSAFCICRWVGDRIWDLEPSLCFNSNVFIMKIIYSFIQGRLLLY